MLEVNIGRNDILQTPKFEVVIEGNYINQFYIEQCISQFNEMKIAGQPKCKLKIKAKDRIEEVDILLVAYLLLFKTELPDLIIEVEFTLNYYSDEVIFKVRQYRAHSFVTSGIMIFTYSCIDFKQDEPFNVYKRDIVCSEKFIPVLLINAKNFNDLFINQPGHLEIQNKIVFEVNWDEQYNACNNFLIENIGHDYTADINILTQLSFYKALSNVKILSFYLYSQLNNGLIIDRDVNLQAGNLRSKAFDYFLSIKDVFEQLEEKPPFFQFIYSTILSSDLLSNALTGETIEEFKRSIKNLFDFTNELFIGIKELADNIVKHSSNHIGVITARVFKAERLDELKSSDQKNLSEIIEKYIQFTFDNCINYLPSFLEINVIDNGKIGIIESLKNNTPVEDLDYKIITKRDISFKHFLDPQTGLILNQQAKRATAHLGLLIFSNLIKINNGIVRASTWNPNNCKRDSHIIIPSKLEILTDNAYACEFGTNYSIIIPFIPTISLSPYLPPTNFKQPSEVTPLQVQSIESLLSYHVYDLTDLAQIDNPKDALFIIKPTNDAIISQKDELELWNEVFIKVSSVFKRKNDRNLRNCFFCINLDTVKINPSQIFRLLGKWELAFPGYPIVIFNLFYELFSQLLEINRFYFESFKNQLPYWNLNSLALIYSYINDDIGRFYFTDALWGVTTEDFMDVNLIIHKSNFNTVVIKSKKIEPNQSSNTKSLNQFGLFYNNSNLLPLDLLLISEEDLSLFEHNALILLQNELSTN
ncbi:MAG: hypothetical protein NTZ69_19100 [Bacteroidia bacterium]|nr:hypothetical protein [Bacteroidia bacterium]